MKYRDKNGNFKELLLKPSGDTLPIGSQIPFSSSVIPGNWLECNGQAVSRTEYADLFRVIGTSYGDGDGSTTFNLPDKRGRQSIGRDTDDTDFDTIGKFGGEKEHTMTVDELVSHKHTVKGWLTNSPMGGVDKPLLYGQPNGSAQTQANSENTGNSQPFNVLDPYEVDCWIIKAKQSIGLVGNVVDTMDSVNPSDVANVKTVKEYVDNRNNYSTDEITKAGYKINGKDVYIKIIECGALPNNSTKAVAHNLNLSEITVEKIEGIARKNDGTVYLNINEFSDNYFIRANIDGANLLLKTNINRDNYNAKLRIYFTYNEEV